MRIMTTNEVEIWADNYLGIDPPEEDDEDQEYEDFLIFMRDNEYDLRD